MSKVANFGMNLSDCEALSCSLFYSNAKIWRQDSDPESWFSERAGILQAMYSISTTCHRSWKL